MARRNIVVAALRTVRAAAGFQVNRGVQDRALMAARATPDDFFGGYPEGSGCQPVKPIRFWHLGRIFIHLLRGSRSAVFNAANSDTSRRRQTAVRDRRPRRLRWKATATSRTTPLTPPPQTAHYLLASGLSVPGNFLPAFRTYGEGHHSRREAPQWHVPNEPHRYGANIVHVRLPFCRPCCVNPSGRIPPV